MKSRENQKGVAILIVLVSLAILTVLVFELAFSTGVQSRLARTFLTQAQAKYLSKTGLNISLLRLYFYMNILNLSQSTELPFTPEAISNLYQFPMPAFPFDEDYMALFPVAVRIELQKFLDESVLGKMSLARFESDIRGMSGAIPINFLDGEPERYSSKKFQDIFKALLEKTIDKDISEDEYAWEQKHGDVLAEDLVWGLINYIDLDNLEQPYGTLEDSYFQQFDPPEFLRHRRFQFPSELTLPRYWDRDIAKKYVKLFNFYAFYPFLNANLMPSEMWKIIFHDPSEDQMDAISERLSESWFQNFSELEEFQSLQELSFTEEFKGMKKILKYYEQTAFRINTRGIIGDIVHEYTAMVIFKPSLAKIKSVEGKIHRLSIQSQQQMQESGDIENPEFQKWKDDPFGFFKTEEELEDEEEEAREEEERRSARRQGTQDREGRKKQKRKGKKSIFDEPPETMEIVYWGAPL